MEEVRATAAEVAEELALRAKEMAERHRKMREEMAQESMKASALAKEATLVMEERLREAEAAAKTQCTEQGI